MTYVPRAFSSDDLHPCLTAQEVAAINTAYPTSKVPAEVAFTSAASNNQHLANINSRQSRKQDSK